MTDRDHENSAPGSPGIPDAGGAGSTGPSRDVSKDDLHGAGARGPENEELEWARRNVKDEPVKKVFRKTELHGATRSSTTNTSRKNRRRTLNNLSESEREELFREFEGAFRFYFDSLAENQNRIEDNLLLQIVDLQRQIEDLECRLKQPLKSVSGNPEVNL